MMNERQADKHIIVNRHHKHIIYDEVQRKHMSRSTSTLTETCSEKYNIHFNLHC